MKNLKIITFASSRWREYKALRLRALQEEPQAYASTYDENIKLSDDSWIQRLKDAREGKKQWLVFAEFDKKILGMAGAFRENESVHVISVYVVPEARGQGISKLLMNDLLMQIRKNKQIRQIIVEVNINQTAAVNLYKSSGFTITGTHTLTLGDGKEHDIYQLMTS